MNCTSHHALIPTSHFSFISYFLLPTLFTSFLTILSCSFISLFVFSTAPSLTSNVLITCLPTLKFLFSFNYKLNVPYFSWDWERTLQTILNNVSRISLSISVIFSLLYFHTRPLFLGTNKIFKITNSSQFSRHQIYLFPEHPVIYSTITKRVSEIPGNLRTIKPRCQLLSSLIA